MQVRRLALPPTFCKQLREAGYSVLPMSDERQRLIAWLGSASPCPSGVRNITYDNVLRARLALSVLAVRIRAG